MRKSVMVPIPTQFKPLVDKEAETMGCYTIVECMGRILDAYFNGKQGKQEAQHGQEGSKEGSSELPRVRATIISRDR